MTNKHLELDLNEYERVLIVGDLHGDYELFKFALDQLGFDEKDFIISVGDLIDRGDKPVECVDYFLYTDNALAIQGNHEDMMIKALVDRDNQWGGCWIQNGGYWFLDYPEALMVEKAKKLAELPLALTVKYNNLTIGICHAESPMRRWSDYTTICGLSKQKDELALWGRDCIKGLKFPDITGVDFTVHGHSVRHQPSKVGNQHWIDTGSIFGTGYGLTISEITETGLKHYRFEKDAWHPRGFKEV